MDDCNIYAVASKCSSISFCIHDLEQRHLVQNKFTLHSYPFKKYKMQTKEQSKAEQEARDSYKTFIAFFGMHFIMFECSNTVF